MVSIPEAATAHEFADVAVFSGGRIAASDAERVAREVRHVLAYRGISGGARVRLSTVHFAQERLLVQVNLRVRDTPTRMQAVTASMDDLSSALMRLDRQIVRAWTAWRPRPWPDRSHGPLSAPRAAVITRRKAVTPMRGTPVEAVAVMDAMDYDVHLFTDAESGEDAVVYRAGPSGLRLERQRRMYPPGWSWSSPTVSAPPVALIVNSRPTPALSEGVAVGRLREQALRFLFFTDPISGRGELLYPRWDGNLGLITPTDANDQDGES